MRAPASAALLATLSWVLPRPVVAAPPPDPDAATAGSEEDATLQDARSIYEQGLAHFETADYGAAIEAWTTAYAMLPNTRGTLKVRLLLLYNLATAHERAYGIDHDPRHLRQSKVLLENFDKSVPTLYDLSDPDDRARADKERAKVRERLEKIEALLQEAEASARKGAEAPRRAEPPSPRPMYIAGGVVTGLGLAGLVVMTAGLAIGARANDLTDLAPTDIEGRRAQFDRGRAGNAMAIAGGAVGGVGMVVGVALLAVGAARAKARKERQPWAAVRVAPAVGPRRGGLVLTGRF